MTEAAQAPVAPAQAPDAPDVALIPTITLPADAPKDFGPREAARALSQERWRKAKEQPAVPEPAAQEPAAAQPQEESSAPVEEQPSADNTTENEPDPEPQAPPIEPPRSWTKEAKERFNSLPRETQEYLVTRETERDREVRRSQNEAAEAKKAIEAERQAVTQQRQQYEQALPQLMNMLQTAQQAEFPDIKSMDDVERLAKEDPFRYAQFAARQQKMAAVAHEAQAAQQRQQAEQSQKWNEYAAKQDQAFIEAVPEASNPETLSKLQQSALAYMTDLGFSREEVTALFNGTVIRDARIQRAILDGARYREAQKAVRTAPVRPVPPVQRPGVSQPRVNPAIAEMDALSKRLEDATGMNALKIAAQLRATAIRAKSGRR